jgi:hypothetical protein
MEHQSMTFIGDEHIDGRRTYESVVGLNVLKAVWKLRWIADWRDFWLTRACGIF